MKMSWNKMMVITVVMAMVMSKKRKKKKEDKDRRLTASVSIRGGHISDLTQENPQVESKQTLDRLLFTEFSRCNLRSSTFLMN